jgi:hypothetical protein
VDAESFSLPSVDGTTDGAGYLKLDLDWMILHAPSLERAVTTLQTTAQQQLSQLSMDLWEKAWFTGVPDLDRQVHYFMFLCRHLMRIAVGRVSGLNRDYRDCHQAYVGANNAVAARARRLLEVCDFEPAIATPQFPDRVSRFGTIEPEGDDEHGTPEPNEIDRRDNVAEEHAVRPPLATGAGMRNSPTAPDDAVAGVPDALESVGPGLDRIYQVVRDASTDLAQAVIATSDFWQGAGGITYRTRMYGEISYPPEFFKLLERVGPPAVDLASTLRWAQREMETVLAGLDGLSIDGQPLGRAAAIASFVVEERDVTATPGDRARFDHFAAHPETGPYLDEFVGRARRAAGVAVTARETFQAKLNRLIDRAEAYRIEPLPARNITVPPMEW